MVYFMAIPFLLNLSLLFSIFSEATPFQIFETAKQEFREFVWTKINLDQVPVTAYITLLLTVPSSNRSIFFGQINKEEKIKSDT